MPQDISETSIAGNIEENKLYQLKRTGASANDIIHVWNYVSTYINDQMLKNKGVNIPGFGQFTFISRKIDTGNNKYLQVQRPVFVLSERFAQKHQLTASRHHLTGKVAVVDLNYTAVAFNTPFSRDLVEECVKDVINEFSRSLSVGKNVEFSFATLGRLSIRNQKVKMKFYKEFINSLEGASEIMNSMKDRPETADSVMSRASTRPFSMNTTVLPGIPDSKSNRKPAMAAIDESGEIELEPVTLTEDPVMQQEIEKLENSGENYFGDATDNTSKHITGEVFYSHDAQELDSMGLPAMLLEERPQPVNLQSKDTIPIAPRSLAPIAKAGAFSLEDLSPLTDGIANRTPIPNTGRKSMPPPMTPLRRSATLAPYEPSPRQSQPSPMNQAPRSAPLESRMGKHATATAAGAAWPAEPRMATPDSQCGHDNAGQELCYLCHQRAARNIPVSFEEERKRREDEEDKLLQEYQIMKNNEFILNENEKNLAKRHALQHQAAFNLGIAEAVTEKKKARAGPEAPKAYIFDKRPLTPPRYLKQQQLNDFLSKQMELRNNLSNKDRADKEFLERLEQVQLAEDLAAQRAQYVKDRYNERDKYREALSTQLKYKPLQVPDKVPDTEVFGKNDTTEADIIARKEHAKRIASEQKNTVADRKRAEILKRIQEQQEEEEMLKKNKAEILDDRSRRYERMVRNRQSLEDEWVKAAEQKKGREIEERLRCLTPGGLVHEQCDKYKRCAQCKKRVTNCGETNLWKESYYIPGARIMV